MYILIRFFVFIIISQNSYTASPGLINITPAAIKNAEQAFKYAREKKWSKAMSYAHNSREISVKKMILLDYYSNNDIKFPLSELKNFFENNKNWPGINLIRKKIEYNLINGRHDKEEILSWFKKYPPLTGNAVKFLAEAAFNDHITFIKTHSQENLANKEKVRNAIKNLWVNNDFTLKEEVNFLLKYSHLFNSNDYVKRVNRLLWDGNYEAATRIIHKLDKAHQQLFKIRIMLAKNPHDDVNRLIRMVPTSLKYDNAIIYEAIKYNIKMKNYPLCFSLINKVKNEEYGGEKWWKIRSRLIREALDLKLYQLAYNMAKNHGKIEQKDKSEAEWLAGWIAYSFLNKLQISYSHFENIYKYSLYPINKARGAYWAAKAAKHLGNKEIADKWYKIASLYNFTFYGQLSMAKLDKEKKVNFSSKNEYTKEDLKNYMKNELIRPAYILASLGKNQKAEQYLEKAIESAKTHGEYVLIAAASRKFNNLWISVSAAKLIARKKNILLTEYGYPQLDLVKKSTNNHDFAHSIIRQETIFDHKAVSKAGALGLMQIMPLTGKNLARELNLKFSEAKLLNDHKYNIKLGTYLLDKLLDKYKGSYILAAAAYNAGDVPVEKWIKDYGDPRLLTKTMDILNWIEHIPYKETREYVLRILENIQIYKTLALGEKIMGIKSDLKNKKYLANE